MGKFTNILFFLLLVTMPHFSICASTASQHLTTTTTIGSTSKSSDKVSTGTSAPTTITTTPAPTTTSMAPTTTTSTATPTTTEAPALGVDCSNKTDADNWCNATITGEAKCGPDGKCSCASLHFSVNNITCIPETDLIPIDLSTPAITINSLNVEWSKKDSVKDLHLSYTVEAKPANTYVGAGLGVVNCTVEAGQMRAACTGLGSGYNYNVTVSTLYASVQTNYFQTIQNSTVPSTPGPLNTSASSFNASNVFLVWTPSQGKVDIYHMKVFQTYEPLILKNLSTNNSNPWIYITDLTPGTNYTFNITAYSYGKSSGETVGTFRTDSTVPGPPGQLQLVTATMNSIKIKWTVTGTPNGDIKGHQVCIKYKFYEDQPYTGLECENTTDGNTVEYEKTGLSAGTTYQFDVYTINDKFISIDSATLQQHTNESVPGKVSELRAIPNDININVTWQRPSRPNGDIIAYQIQWTGVLGQQNCTLYPNLDNSTKKTMRQCSHNISQPDESLENIEYVIRNLMPHTGYLIEVRAYTSVGPGEVSNITVYTNVSVPDPVTNVSVVVLNATSVNVSWTIPDSNPGPVTYTVTANNMVDSSSADQSCSVQNYTSSSCVVPGLQEYWVYNFSVVASTDAGSSKAAVSDSKTTEEAAPGVISDYSFELYNTTENCDATKVTIHWAEPELVERNSLIVKYTFYVDETPKLTYSVTDPKPYSPSNRKFTETFVELKPEVLHTWKVRAVNSQSTAGEVTIFEITQGVCVPPSWSDEDIKAVEEIISTPSTVTIQLPSTFFKKSQQGNIEEKGLIVLPKESKFFDETSLINHAELEAWAEAHSSRFEKEYKVEISEVNMVQFMIGKDTECKTAESVDNFCNGPLPEQFSFRLAAYVCTKRTSNLLCRVSKPFGPFATKEKSDPGSSDSWVIAVAVVMVLAAVIGAFAFLTYKGVIKPKSWLKLGGSDEEEQPFTPIDRIEKNRPIPLSCYFSVLEDMHRDTNLQLSDQYDDINKLGQMICDMSTTDAAKLESNTPKNRWVNILPFDHSRVKLQQIDEDDPTTDYINANYIPGFYNKREYIATQGPLPGTIDDFWRMIWEHNVLVIVMLTQCKEGNRVKCEKYWPDELREAKQYGEVVVNPISISQLDKYNISIFDVSVNGQQSRQVIHFHYLDFPDFSANVEFDHFINFVKTVRGHVPHDMVGPMVVHCSAGVGRTGTFIATDRLNLYLNSPQFNENDDVDIFGIVVSMRENRISMVQTESQFIMIHDCFEKMLEDKKRSLEMTDSDENLYANQGFEPFPEVLYENVSNSKQQTEL